MSPVNHRGPTSGLETNVNTSPTYFTQKSRNCKIHKISLDTNIKQTIQTSNTNYQRNRWSGITPVKHTFAISIDAAGPLVCMCVSLCVCDRGRLHVCFNEHETLSPPPSTCNLFLSTLPVPLLLHREQMGLSLYTEPVPPPPHVVAAASKWDLLSPAVWRKAKIVERVRTRVVVVVVNKLLFLVTSVIYMRIRGYHNSLPHSFRFSSKTAFLPQWIRNSTSTLFVK